MKSTTTAAFFLLPYFTSTVSAAGTETHITAAEWAVPTANNDPHTCPLRSIPYYLTAAPTPTAALESALFSYESKLYAACSSTRTLASTQKFQPCPVPPRATLCAFSTAIPTSLRPVYSSYASSAASWWSAGNGNEVVSLVKECPWLWYQLLLRNPGKGANLNRTVAHAQCWAEAHPTGSGGPVTLPLTGTSTKAASRSGVTGSAATPTPTGTSGVRGRADAADSWMVAGSGMGVAAAVNVGLL